MENFKKKVAGVRLFDDFEADWTKILYFTLDKEPTRYGATADDEKCADLGFFDAETVWIWVAASGENNYCDFKARHKMLTPMSSVVVVVGLSCASFLNIVLLSFRS